MSEKKLFRTAYVVEGRTYDFTALSELAERIQFITTGYERDDQIMEAVRRGFSEYESELDVIVPVGSVLTNLLVGIELGKLQLTPRIAVYREKQYEVAAL